MKQPHLFWILIDSARNYETDQDMRGLPKAVVDFGKEGIYYKNVITSAPSTLQSISSMMTSSPSYLMSRSYNNFRGKFSCFDYFPDMLRENGYDIIGAIYFKHGREVMSDIFGLVDKRFYPKGLTHSQEVWTNKDVYNLFLEVLKKQDWSKPTMTYLHFNVRVDANVSDTVNQVVEDIKAKGLFDNSVILMNSDHGYPDADKGYNFEEGLKEGWGHDKYLTNDNILTPLVIRHPEVSPKVIEEAVASIDIVPTLCGLMNIKPSDKFHGIDLEMKDVDLSKRLIRTDNRYVGQSPSFHAYTQGKQKLIAYRDEGKKDVNLFYNLDQDPKEETRLPQSPDFDSFYDSILKDEESLNEFHKEFLKNGWQEKLKKEIQKAPEELVLVLPSTFSFRRIAKKALSELFPNAKIVFHDEAEQKRYPLLIYILESEIPWDLKKLRKLGAPINAGTTVFVDNNGEYFNRPISFNLYKRFICKRWSVIKHEPNSILDLFNRVLKRRLLKPIR